MSHQVLLPYVSFPKILTVSPCLLQEPMTRLRKTIARRLKESQETAASLTTFNEVHAPWVGSACE